MKETCILRDFAPTYGDSVNFCEYATNITMELLYFCCSSAGRQTNAGNSVETSTLI